MFCNCLENSRGFFERVQFNKRSEGDFACQHHLQRGGILVRWAAQLPRAVCGSRAIKFDRRISIGFDAKPMTPQIRP